MFEHLDDPAGYAPGPDLKTAVVRRSRSRRRRAWLARSGVAAVVAVAGVAVGSAALVDRKLDDVERVEVVGLAPEPAAPADPYVILVVGVDQAGLLGAGDPVAQGRPDDGVLRSDTVVVARVDPAADRVTVLPFPRDLWGPIPGHDDGRLNQATALGGPGLLIDTLRARYGIEVARYVEVDFAGTIAIADAVGGLRLSFPLPLRDAQSGLAVGAGCQVLDGRQVLALARSRHAEGQQPDGRWRKDLMSDLGRIERQQAVGAALLAAFSHLDRTDPHQSLDLLDALARHVVLDADTSNRDLLATARDLAGSRIDQRRLPLVDARYGGADVLELAAGADTVLAELSGTGAPDPVPTPPADGGPTTTATPGLAEPPSTTTTPTFETWARPSEFVPTPC